VGHWERRGKNPDVIGTMTARYLEIFNEFVDQLDDDELQNGYFQQDGATCHTSNESMTEIESFFDDRIISKALWPPRSPDLSLSNFFLWGAFKRKSLCQQATHHTGIGKQHST